MKKKLQNLLPSPLTIFFVLSLNSIPLTYASKTDEGYIIQHASIETFQLLKSRPEFTVDHLTLKTDLNVSFELYGPAGLGEFLEQQNIESTPIESINKKVLGSYPTPEELGIELQNLNRKYSSISKLFSIGKSVNNRELWIININGKIIPTNSKSQINSKPKFLLVANMHGDEITGREVLMQFIKELLFSYGTDPKLTNIIDQLDIYLMPSLNPDGAAKGKRGNGHNVDLNRNFPDFTTSDNQNTILGREPETMALMTWQKNKNFVLSANFHGGAEVVNYPWDTTDALPPGVDIIKDISLHYAQKADYIGNSTTFENGITNGYAWYEVNGGMQDWNNYYENNPHITIELSDDKWPAYSRMQYYYQENREALIYLLEKAAEDFSFPPMTIEHIKLEPQKVSELLKP